MPEIVKRMLKKDSTVINRLKYDAYQLPQDPRIWTFPKFKSLGAVNEMIDMEDLAKISPYKFNEVFPDPQDYCIGAVLLHPEE